MILMRPFPITFSLILAACGGGSTAALPTAPTAAPPRINLAVEFVRPAVAGAQDYVRSGFGISGGEATLRATVSTTSGRARGSLACEEPADFGMVYQTLDLDLGPSPTVHEAKVPVYAPLPVSNDERRVRCTVTPGVGFSAYDPVTVEAAYVWNRDTTPLQGPCVESPTTMCVLDGRFEVSVNWQKPLPGYGLVASRFSDGGGFKLMNGDQPVTSLTQDLFVRMSDQCQSQGRFGFSLTAFFNYFGPTPILIKDRRGSSFVEILTREPIGRLGNLEQFLFLDALRCEPPR